MISLADVSNTNEGLVVLDPMCGAGTLLVEAMVQQRNDWHIGFDCRWKLQSTPAIDVLKSNVNFSVTALELSQENLQFACDIPSETQVRWDLLIADATVMPLRNSSVDRILSDIPFGKKHKSAQPIELLFVKLLSEIKRVLRPAGSAVLLCPLLVKKLAQSQLAEINKVANNQ